jgi:hypothetical protein
MAAVLALALAAACLVVGVGVARALSTDPTYDWYTPGQSSYVLSTVGDICGFANLVNGTADVDGDGVADEAVTFQGVTVTVAESWNGSYSFGGMSWTPIGSAEHPFLGSFDGGGSTFDNFRICVGTSDADAIDRTRYLGFFGYVGGDVSNVAIGSNASLVAESDTLVFDHVGMVAGYCGGSLSNCSNAASVQVSSNAVQTKGALQMVGYVGGVAGTCAGSVTNCSNAGALTVSSGTTPETDLETSRIVQYVGGVVGFCGDETRVGTSTEAVESEASQHGSISGCTNVAQITVDTPSTSGVDRFGSTAYARSEAVGGIVGYSQGSVSNCVNGEQASNDSVSNVGYIRAEHGTSVGGIVGSLRYFMQQDNVTTIASGDDGNEKDALVLSNCVNYGDLYGLNSVGGIAGATGSYTTISGCMNMYKTYTSGDTTTEVRSFVVATRWNKPAPAGIVGNAHGDVCYCANFATIMSGTWKDESTRSVDVASGYYASGIAGFLVHYEKKDETTNVYEPSSPIPECYGCYNEGTILAKSGMRQRSIVGQNDGYTHDNISLKGVVENDNCVYGDEEDETEASGSVSNNVVYTAEQLRSSDAVALLNTMANKGGWSTYWVSSDGDAESFDSNMGYPMISWNSPWTSANDLSAGTAVVTENAIYTGGESVPSVSVTLAGQQLVQNVDFYVEPQAGAVELGDGYLATIHGMGAYSGTISGVSYSIVAGSIASCTVTATAVSFNYESQMPTEASLKVTSGTVTLDPSEYRIVSVKDSKGNETDAPTNAGAYTVTIEPVEGSTRFAAGTQATGTYRIKPVDLLRECSYDNVVLTYAGQTYPWVKSTSNSEEASNPSTTLPYAGGTPVEPTVSGVTYTVNGVTHTLEEGVDYRLVYGNANSDDGNSASSDKNNVGVAGGSTIGSVTVRYVSNSNFINYANMFFNITDSGEALDLAYATYSAPDQVYDGTAFTPVTLYYGGAELTCGTDYDIEYQNNVEAGTATFTATGKGAYTGTISGSFQIADAPVYELLYSYDTETATAAVTGVEVYSQRDYVDIAIPAAVEHDGVAYEVTSIASNAFGGELQTDYEGSLANTSKLKVRAVSIPATVTTIGNYAFGSANTSYGGTLSEVTFAESSKLTTIGDHAFAYCTNITSITLPEYVDVLDSSAFKGCTGLTSLTFLTQDPSLPSSIATSRTKGAFAGCAGVSVTCYPSATAVRELVAANSDDVAGTNGGARFTLVPFSLEDAQISFDASTYDYTGSAIEPTVSVSVGNAVLAEGTDYTLAYSNNVNVGTATVTVTGVGSWTGSATAQFTIVAEAVPMNRLYNPNGGEHFYTASASERDYLVKLGWVYEGIGWTAPSSSNTPVYRLYNPNGGDHHYTASVEERDGLVKVGWVYEGIGWYSDDAKTVALYRQYNPNAQSGSHNYTTSKEENDMLVKVGWRAEGIGWYGL